MEKQIKQLNDALSIPSSVVFLTGGAGVGKTTLLNSFEKESDKNMLKLATTGAAALLIGGSTVESALHIPPVVNDPVYDIKKIYRHEKITAISYSDIIVIDEASMLRPDKLDYIDYALRLNLDSEEPFASKKIFLVGDLYQLPPVVSTSNPLPAKYETPFFYSADVLNKVKFLTIELTKVHRQKDEIFIDALNAIRVGKTTKQHLDYLNQKVVDKCPEDAITLSPYNETVKRINNEKLSKIENDLFVITAEIDGKAKETDFIGEKELQLKVGARVMLIKNEVNGAYVNGSVGVITKIDPDGAITVILDNGNTIDVNKEVWQKTETVYSNMKQRNEQKVVGTIRQYPIKLAWAISIHKSQGATYDKVHIDLGRGTFAPGQLYVALSRLRSYDGLSLAIPISSSNVIVDKHIQIFFNKTNDINKWHN